MIDSSIKDKINGMPEDIYSKAYFLYENIKTMKDLDEMSDEDLNMIQEMYQNLNFNVNIATTISSKFIQFQNITDGIIYI